MVEHGGLTCSNILLTWPDGGDVSQLVVNQSNITISRIPFENTKLSDYRHHMGRYKAPERLAQAIRTDFSLADTYSLGLCIIVAATGEPPFGVLGDDEVIDLKLRAVPIERPEEEFTDAEWDLVASMCDNDPLKRPSLDVVIEKMEELDRQALNLL